ncbi:hypothetical protein ACEQ8H_003465 [Pleosporales sp. CAS-2024a]
MAPEARCAPLGEGNGEAIAMESAQTSQPRSPKARSLSDSTPRLEPSPKFREPARMSRDDQAIVASPSTPRRPDFLTRGLSLQMPAREAPMPSPAHFAARVPLSPQLDSRNTYASPTSLLPRRSRGAEFSRACTNLHQSTLPEQLSPDSSPTITQKGVKIPSRRPRSNSMLMNSPGAGMHGWGTGDRTAASSSVGSINMLGSDDSSSSSDEVDPLDPEDQDDPMMGTPQAKMSTAFPPSNNPGWVTNMFSPVAGGIPNFMSIQRARLRRGRSRKSSSSASGHSSMASPGPASPPNGGGKNDSYFAREAAMRKAGSRRESLSLFANDLHISSGNDSGDEAVALPQTPGVVRRPVVRRGNLLPKSRQFGRIKAELFEESAPVDSEVRREAEIIRQVREADEGPSITAQSSPSLLPSAPDLDGPLGGVPELPEEESEGNMSVDGSTTKALFGLFGSLHSTSRNSVSSDFWNSRATQTPPPPSFPRAESSVVSEDMSMDSPTISSSHGFALPDPSNGSGWVSRASTPGPMYPPTAAEGLKKSNKRRRDDDFDQTSIKRRAVSPGLSVQNSPIISQSPAQRGDGGIWGNNSRPGRETSVSGQSNGERSNSAASMSMTPTLGPKRVGLMGMENANDGLMKMSIE